MNKLLVKRIGIYLLLQGIIGSVVNMLKLRVLGIVVSIPFVLFGN